MMKFADWVYEITRNIPAGRVTTYKIIAQKLRSKAYRAVGQALRNNPYAPQVPCHRVIKSNGMIGGFMGEIEGESIKRKIKLLKSEGVKIKGNRVMDFKKLLFIPYCTQEYHQIMTSINKL